MALRPEQARAAALLGRGLSCRATANELSVSERSLTRWRKLPDFQAAVQRARADHMSEQPNPRPPAGQAASTVTTVDDD